MTQEDYRRITGAFRDNPKRTRALHITNRITTIIVVLSYAGLLLWDFFYKKPHFAANIIVPLDAFIIVTVFRFLVNRERPYQYFDLPPVLPKDKKGLSFPSRHTFCAFMVGMTFLLASPFPGYGIFLLAVAAVIGVIRIAAGVHYPSDVAAGAAAGILFGIIGYGLWR